MNREGALGIILVALLLGGIMLFRRPSSYSSAIQQTGNLQVIPVQAEPRLISGLRIMSSNILACLDNLSPPCLNFFGQGPRAPNLFLGG